MICIHNFETNPFFNIAAEEYFLKNFTDDIFMLYRNSPSVVVGKHQNALAEVDIHYLKTHNIELVRRLSGGGAVYHDLGNVNFTFIRNGSVGSMVDFKGFTKPIIDYLTTLGLNANFGGHNSIMVNNFKVSGNAEHIYRNRVLHHGTLLFNANLEQLEKCLYTNRERFTDRAVRSVRANVSNISTLLNNPISIEILATNLFDFISNSLNASPYKLNDFDIESIKSLSTSRYSTTEWNLGYSPKYELPIFIEIDGNNYTFQLKVENGVIVSAESESNLPLIEIICSALLNCQHEPIAVIDKFKNYGINDDIANRIIEGMF
jgi:lipoate-protein ligase A